jgi:hypothetical protein
LTLGLLAGHETLQIIPKRIRLGWFTPEYPRQKITLQSSDATQAAIGPRMVSISNKYKIRNE